MRGIEESERLYREHFIPALEAEYPECGQVYAAGLSGSGSECYGTDDLLSRDHAFSNGFYIWLTDEDDIKFGVRLNRIYRSVFGSFGTVSELRGANGCERGVITLDEFFLPYLGRRGLPTDIREWLSIPDRALAEALNGGVFYDGRGALTEYRRRLSEDMPRDIRLKRAAAAAALAAQAGQYNFHRCISRGDNCAAALCIARFAEELSELLFIIEDSFAPYYKQRLAVMRTREEMRPVAEGLSYLLSAETSRVTAEQKLSVIEELSADAAERLVSRGMSEAHGSFLEPHAYSIMSRIKEPFIRSLHIMEKGSS